MLTIIRDPSELQATMTAWNTLADHQRHPLLRYEWFKACAEAYSEPSQLHIMIQESAKGINAIAPLVLVRRGVSKLEMLGSASMDEPGGLLYKDTSALYELIQNIINAGKPILLNRFSSESPEVSIFRQGDVHGARSIIRGCAGTPFLPITASWDEYEGTISARRRYDIRRARKRAEQLGRVEFEISTPTTDRLDQNLKELFLVEASGWKGRKKTAIMFDRRLKLFLETYSRHARDFGALKFCSMRINDRPAAVILAVEYYQKFWVLKIGYDEAFSSCSPGILLIHHTLRYAHEHHLEAYEFLGADAEWLHMWTRQKHSYKSVRIYPRSVSGNVGLSLDITSYIIRRIFNHLPFRAQSVLL